MNLSNHINVDLSSLNAKRLLISIITLAAVLRLWGIWHGYPYSYYPDESHFVKRALSFGSGDLNPHWFHKPAFYMYLLFFEYGLFYFLGKVAGFWSSVSEFALYYIKNPGPFYIIGRLATVIFSLGSIWVVYLLGEKHFKKGTGIAGALLLTLSYGHIVASQDVKADTPAMFFGILSLYFLLNFIKRERPADIILAAAFSGMGTATKIYPIVLLIPIVIGILFSSESRKEIDLHHRAKNRAVLIIFALLSFWLIYFICSPYNFIDPLGRHATFGRFIGLSEKILSLFGWERAGHPADFIGNRMGLFEGTLVYLKVLFAKAGLGRFIAGMGIVGIGYLICNFSKQVLAVLLYLLLFISISVFTAPGYAESRHQLPIYPVLAFSGGFFIVGLTQMKANLKHIIHIVLIIFLCYPLYQIVERNIFISKEDTRNIAKKWIENNIAPGTKILADVNGPQLLMGRERIREIMEEAMRSDPKGQFTAHYATYLKYQLLAAKDSVTYDLYALRLPWWREKEVRSGVHKLTSIYDRDMGNPLKEVGVNKLDYYLENRFKYVIVHSEKYKAFLKPNSTASERFPSFARFYTELFQKGAMIKEFCPDEGNRPGPIIKIFRLRKS